MYLSSYVFLLIGYFKLSNAEKITVREGREGVLTCSPGNVLNITFAKYEGRPRFCSRHEVTSIVQRQCQMKQTCTVYAEDKYYVDSCLVASEVLTIRYYCIEVYTSITTPQTTRRRTQTAEVYTSITTPQTTRRRTQTTRFITVSTTANIVYSTRRRSLGKNDSDTDVTEDNSFTNSTDVQPRGSMLTDTASLETITIATLIAGCIFGLLLISLITLAIFRRFRENKMATSDNVHILQLNPLPDQEHDNTNNHAQSSRRVLPSTTSNMSSRSFQNNNYDLEAFIIHTSSDTTEEQEQTNPKTTDHEEGIYCFIEANSADSLPPLYDVARGNSSPTETKYNTNMYNIAHYSADEYNQTSKPGPLQWSGNLTDSYSTSATFLLEAAQCSGCNGNSHVYENENIRFNSLKNSLKKSVNANSSGKVPSCRKNITSSGKQSDLCVKNDHSQSSGAIKVDDTAVVCSGKSNKYENIEFKKSSKKTNYQNITEDDLSDKCPRYMPMDFKESIKGRKTCVETDHNIYVPIMSPTSVSTPDVFDDIYQC